MSKVSKNFSRHEFECKCGCSFNAVGVELLSVLEATREHFNTPTTLNCANRCPAHNAEVGGAPASQHLQGIAADIVVKRVTPADVADYFENKYSGKYGIGRYNTFTHIDVRPGPARWNG